jgi:hypothetical protein
VSGPLTEEKKDRIVRDYITKKTNQRYQAFAKYHPDANQIREFLVSKIREQITKGSNYPDAPLEDMMAKELYRISIMKTDVTPAAITAGQRSSHGEAD